MESQNKKMERKTPIRDISAQIKKISSLLPQAMLKEQAYVFQASKNFQKYGRHPDKYNILLKQLTSLEKKLEKSIQERKFRLHHKPEITYPPELPITKHRNAIIQAIQENPVVIISGETGCGKSTQIPKMCLEAGRGIAGKIACTQPRRIAATTIAHRIAEELGEILGRSIGYKIRFQDKTPHNAYIKIMTDGMLLAETQSDAHLYEYDTFIIDEAHERSLNIDFLLGIAKTLLALRPELKIIITSATLDIVKFSQAFDNPPVLEVSGRLYPVEVEYKPSDPESSKTEDADYVEMAVKAIDYLKGKKSLGDILVFMPTEQDILETRDRLEGRKFPGVTILPLYARLPGTQQHLVYTVKGPKIVIATNVAETSLTIPGIKYVVDTGLARISRYLPETRTNSLPIRPISQSSADQRMGRSGRVQKGFCIRLYPQEDYESRAKFTPPEIMRSNLAEVILRMISLNLGHPSQFPFVDRPHPKNIADGYNTLLELGAITRQDRNYILTGRGRQMARMPLDPRISRLLLESQNEGCLQEVAIIASALSIRNPRERPPEKAAHADQMHEPFKNPDSDFLTLLNIWNRYHSDWEKLTTQGKKRRFCRDHFLSFSRMREWVYVHDQIISILKDLKIPPGRQHKGMSKSLYAAIHRSVLSGYLSNIAVLKEKNIYQAAKGRETMVFPGSTLFNKSSSWIVAAEMIQTTRLFARTAAKINAGWLETLGGDLCRYSYSGAHWDKNRGDVLANERVTLYGLEIVSERLVPYGSINPEESQRIFIRSALVAGNVKKPPDFLVHNLGLWKKISRMEEKLRRRDILVSAEIVADFYSKRLEGIYNIVELKEKVKQQGNDDFLKMGEEDLLRSSPDEEELDLFPDELALGENHFEASYKFAPGEEEDGITLKIPSVILANVPVEGLEWGVPGSFREKITALIKGLPKRYRKQLVPVSDTVDVIEREMEHTDPSLFSNLTQFIRKRFGVYIPASDWTQAEIPKHLKMRIAVTDHQGKEVNAGRDLKALLKKSTEVSLEITKDSVPWKKARQKWEKTGLTTWNFGTLPEKIPLGPSVIAFLGLEPSENSVNIRLFKTKGEALSSHKKGVQTLLLIQYAQDLKFEKKYLALPEENQKKALYFGGKTAVENMVLENLKKEIFQKDLRTEEDFKAYAETVGRAMSEKGYAIWEMILKILDEYHRTRVAIDNIEKANLTNRIVTAICSQVRSELTALAPKDFIKFFPIDRLLHLPRYMIALQIRADRAKNDPEKDNKKNSQVDGFSKALDKMQADISSATSLKKREAIQEYRWMIEEFKVSLFAPELKTAYPISALRLTKKQKQIEEIL